MDSSAFILFSSFLIPVIMILFGKIFSKRSPKAINHFYGYRTKMSMKNKNTWDFAHKYFGKLFFKAGIIILPLSVVAMIIFIIANFDNIEIYSGILILVQAVFIVFPIIATEKALKEMFDKDGNYKQQAE